MRGRGVGGPIQMTRRKAGHSVYSVFQTKKAKIPIILKQQFCKVQILYHVEETTVYLQQKGMALSPLRSTL
jgi:hypothetical protein